MKKCVIFLINGLGIEKPGSYSIAIDQVMPNLYKIKESSYFTTAITSSLEYREAYQRFFLGDTYRSEVDYIKSFVVNERTYKNPTFLGLKNSSANAKTKLHIFLEPSNEKVVNQVNNLVNMLDLPEGKKVYLHLILSQQVVKEYSYITSIVNYIKFHLNDKIDVGFIIGKESLDEEITKGQLNYTRKMFYYCSCERWAEIEKKFQTLASTNVRPCDVIGFCSNNTCNISNGDTIFFFNTRRENYDNFVKAIYQNAPTTLGSDYKLETFSLIKLYSRFNIPAFVDNIDYQYSLSNILLRNNKKCLIITDDKNINLVNFYANGLNSINNPIISFMQKSDSLYDHDYIEKMLDEMPYDLIIFDYHMNTATTINDLKEHLSKLDIIIKNLGEVCENKHSLFITSLYGLRKTLPIADYNDEMVTIDYEMQIPIFFYDYEYPHSKYDLFPGETNDILCSALKCITNDPTLDSLIREKTLIGSILKSFIK